MMLMIIWHYFIIMALESRLERRSIAQRNKWRCPGPVPFANPDGFLAISRWSSERLFASDTTGHDRPNIVHPGGVLEPKGQSRVEELFMPSTYLSLLSSDNYSSRRRQL